MSSESSVVGIQTDPHAHLEPSVREMVFRYLSLDENLQPRHVRDLLLRDHRIKISDQMGSFYRKQYFASTGKSPPKCTWVGGKGKSKIRGVAIDAPRQNIDSNSIIALERFVAGVKAVGGKQVALQLLTIIS